jgi:hypothetical protein
MNLELNDTQKEKIGEYIFLEVQRNRKFRREVSRLPLGLSILYIIDHPNQLPPKKKISRFKRFINKMRNIFNNEYTLYGSAKG